MIPVKICSQKVSVEKNSYGKSAFFYITLETFKYLF